MKIQMKLYKTTQFPRCKFKVITAAFEIRDARQQCLLTSQLMTFILQKWYLKCNGLIV